jgi:hypothetical protein
MANNILKNKTNSKYKLFCNNIIKESNINYGTLDQNHKNKISEFNENFKNIKKYEKKITELKNNENIENKNKIKELE